MAGVTAKDNTDHPIGVIKIVPIEPAEATDVPEIKQVLSQTWLDTYGHFLSVATVQIVTTVWHAPELLAAQVKNPDILFRLAKDETGAIVGLITAHQNDQDSIMIN